ncbi:hypothetical protein TMEN_8751 [Trichophyton mentagrophytes]|nr:hypothetical protein TMEN_8751 [Trichophyton mentagrophytes]
MAGHKRRRLNPGVADPFRRYPDIPESLQDLPANRPSAMTPVDGNWSCSFISCVEKTKSTEWGSPKVAAARAVLEDAVTADNEKLVRTYHPALSVSKVVSIYQEMSGKIFWLVEASENIIDYTHAAGREIHIERGVYAPHPLRYMLSRDIHISRFIYPRRMLTAMDIVEIQRFYPNCIGIRIFVSGYAVFLFRNMAEMQSAWSNGNPDHVGGLVPRFDIVDITPCRETIPLPSGHGIAPAPNSFTSQICLGLKIRLVGGEEAITTVTHGFVKLPQSVPRFPRAASWMIRAKQRLQRFLPNKPLIMLPGEVECRQRGVLGSSALGKAVFLSGEATKIGTITTTYDNPSPLYPYPAGYTHDLSLFTDSNLPRITSPAGVGMVTGWADYIDALEGKPVFATTFDVWINKERQVEGQIDTNSTKQAMIEGAEYMWESSAITASLLWRTVGKDNQSVGKFSGSVLCLGRPTDENVKAVVFQNYVTPVKEGQIRGEVPLSSTFNPTMKAGFLLPSEIRESEIICEPKQSQERGLNSLPTRGENPPCGNREKKFFTGPR